MPAILAAFLAVDASGHGLHARERGEAKSGESLAGRGPLVLVISIRKQQVSVYGPHGKITDSGVSTGQPGHETPTGVFSIIGKEVMHHSNLYGDAPMPYMQRITWSGVALHAGQLPGYAASHGCIRLPYGFARSLFPMTRMGTRVIVAKDDPVPQSFNSQRLIAPLPSEAQVARSAETAAPGASEPVRTAASQSATGVEAVLGVSSANAATVPAPAIRTREAVQRERAAQAEARLKFVETAKTALSEALDRQVAAAAALAEAKDRLQGAHDEMVRVASDIVLAEQSLANALAQLKVLVATRGGTRGDLADADIERGADREDAIEANIGEFANEAAEAHARAETRAGATAPLVEAVKSAEAAIAATLEGVKTATLRLKTAEAAVAEALKLEAHHDLPISILVSRKTGRVHVRQGFEDLFDAPITIADPVSPIGTHVFTALEFEGGETALRWNVVSVNAAGEVVERPRGKRRGEPVAQTEAGPLEPQTPARALERIAFDPATLEKLQELIKPSSTLTISDLPISRETGRGTDFVLLTRQ